MNKTLIMLLISFIYFYSCSKTPNFVEKDGYYEYTQSDTIKFSDEFYYLNNKFDTIALKDVIKGARKLIILRIPYESCYSCYHKGIENIKRLKKSFSTKSVKTLIITDYTNIREFQSFITYSNDLQINSVVLNSLSRRLTFMDQLSIPYLLFIDNYIDDKPITKLLLLKRPKENLQINTF